MKTRFAIALAGAAALASGQAPRPAVPLEPIAAILDAFHDHRVVALGEGSHGNLQGHAFRLSLIRDPRFAAVVNDIVVEFGSARYQDAMDRFVRGEELPASTLSLVWRNTTQADAIWDTPIYEAFFRAVRDVNASLPTERKLRVLLGDPPVDWDTVHTLADLRPWLNRDAHAAAVIRREVLAKGRRALVIYGDEHIARGAGIVGILEQEESAVFTIHTETREQLPGAGAWPAPSLAVTHGTILGVDRFDAILYLGPPSTITLARISPTLCADPAYMKMRLARMALLPPPPGAPVTPIEKLKADCAFTAASGLVPDSAPQITATIREILRDAAKGKADPARFAPESRDRLVQFLSKNGPRFLGGAGELESLTLLTDGEEGEQRLRRYRAAFADGQKILWTVVLNRSGLIVSLDPRRE